MKNQIVRARIEGSLKTEALEVLASHGLDLSDAIRLFLRQVVARGGIPFPIRNQRNVRGASSRQLPQVNQAFDAGDGTVLAHGEFAAGELFLIRPEDARAAKVEWPACRLND